MRTSIRAKLFFSITALIVFFVLFSWLLNTQYLGKYYRAEKENTLLTSSQTIRQVYQGDPEDISLDLERLERMSGSSIVIMDSSFTVKYNSAFRVFNGIGVKRNPDHPQEPEQLPLSLIREHLPEIMAGDSIFIATRDRRLNADLLNLVVLLDNQDILLLSIPLTAIQESAAIANRFFLFTGLLTILIGSLAGFWFAKRFTRPFIDLNEMAQKMANLDFTTKYPVTSKDEIGELGTSINRLSTQLDLSISELRDANIQLKLDIERERKIDEMRKEFVSNVSHELKTPIALIQGYAEGLQDNVIEDEANRNYYAAVIVDEAGKMDKLVKGLLDLSQVESGFFQLEKHDFEINALVEKTLLKFSPVFAKNNIQPLLQADSVSIVHGDMFRIEQILVNYINNAVHHLDDKKLIKVAIDDHAGKIRITVTNSGKPIPEEALEKIWTSFYKVDKARTRSMGGTGLGLSIVRAIQELHHNAYGVNNLPDGVAFWFEIDRGQS